MNSAKTITKTVVVVNPAFLQEIKDSNPDLWQVLLQVRQTCSGSQDSTQVASKIVRLLDELRDQLALQFALEESYGYLDVPAGISNSISELANRTRSQHCSLYLEISELAEKAEELQYRGLVNDRFQEIVIETLKFDEQFRDHERLEEQLIEKSFGSS